MERLAIVRLEDSGTLRVAFTKQITIQSKEGEFAVKRYSAEDLQAVGFDIFRYTDQGILPDGNTEI